MQCLRVVHEAIFGNGVRGQDVRQVVVEEEDGLTKLNLILEREDALSGVLANLTGRGSDLISLEKREPTLEDVFMNLVGRSLTVDTSHTAEETDG